MKQLYYKVDKCLGCKSCEIACVVAHSESGDLIKALKDAKPEELEEAMNRKDRED